MEVGGEKGIDERMRGTRYCETEEVWERREWERETEKVWKKRK